MRAKTAVAIGVLLGGVGCLTISGPSGYGVQYRIGVFACDTMGCEVPDTVIVSAAAPGDTVWVLHEILLVRAPDSTFAARLRPLCAENVTVVLGSNTVQSLPDVADCPDSTVMEDLVLGVPVERYNRWVLDTTLTPAMTYALIGRILVQPRLEPVIGFQVQ